MKKILFVLITIFICNMLCASNSKIVTKNIKSRIEYVGNVISDKKIEVKSKSSGEIISLMIDEGDVVYKNKKLLSLDSESEKNEYEQSLISIKSSKNKLLKAETAYQKSLAGPEKEEIEKVKAAWEEAQLNYDNAKRQYDLQISLYKQNAVTLESKNEHYNKFKVSEASLKKAKAAYELTAKGSSSWDLKMLEQDQDEAKYQYEKSLLISKLKNINLKNKNLHAPFDGVITKLYVNKGDMLNVGTKICDLLDVKNLYIEIFVAADDMFNLYYGQRAEITTDIMPNKIFHGEVSYISPEAKLPERNFRVKIKVTNDFGFLKPGMFTRIILKNNTELRGYFVPKIAVSTKQNGQKIIRTNYGKEISVRIIRKYNNFYQVKGSELKSSTILKF